MFLSFNKECQDQDGQYKDQLYNLHQQPFDELSFKSSKHTFCREKKKVRSKAINFIVSEHNRNSKD